MSQIEILPASVERFEDVEHAMTGGGDGASCWCQWWMVTSTRFRGTSRDEKRELLREQTADGAHPSGLVAYVDGEAAGWVKVAPRTEQPRIARTRAYQCSPSPFDDPGVWAITCFVVRREHRGQGLGRRLLDAAVAHARASGAHVVEGYPLDATATKVSSNSLFHGALSTFLDAGFEEVARDKPARPVVALRLG
ncbi:GNAT family N-acetyltransferase [Microbacterium sp. No. 7]|uniref:GNAT family N-acetyltransferase n=1 Tax=Microbacterium sp. No. 7 TaxID=1714373 RepID=UPI0006D29F99|nr:GNAT family N-acetyltransferase [Microbacterium sp. No. 7]ALJ20948.1 acetyltransferase [Microbacterium sp. No. 7]